LGASFNVNARNGPTATDAQVQQVLASLTGLYIQPDVINGPEYTFLDNVALEVETTRPVPAPATLPVFLVGLGALAITCRRRKAG